MQKKCNYEKNDEGMMIKKERKLLINCIEKDM